MPDMRPKVFFDGDPCLSFVAGEDRTFVVTFMDRSTGLPIDLTGGTVFVNFPREGGGVIKRSSSSLILSPANVSAGAPGDFSALDHGLVSGDPVRLALTSGALPAPLVAATTYYAWVSDPDNFNLLNSSGALLSLSSTGSGVFTIGVTPSDVTLSSPTLGAATLTLRAGVTQSIAPGLGQGFEVGYVLGGKTRIIALAGVLDVVPAPAP